jgi:hypothetical protein
LTSRRSRLFVLQRQNVIGDNLSVEIFLSGNNNRT